MSFKHFTLSLLGLFMVASSFAQGSFEFKLQLMQEELTWGVYMRADGSSLSSDVLTASGQVTLVMPADFEFMDEENHNGVWTANAIVDSPVEDVTRRYVSFGFTESPLYPMDYLQEEILLFTFKGEVCPDSLYLIDCNTPNVTDPFCPDFQDSTPGQNSTNSNPGNEISVLDFGQGGLFYFYHDNYARSAWNCHDCDGDGIPNAHEDTNGNGVYDPGIDESDLCDGGMDPCEGIVPEFAVLSGGASICAGEETDLFVEITGGQGPFLVVLSDGAQNIYVDDYESGMPIPVSPTEATQYSIVKVEAGPVCELVNGVSGSALVLVSNGLEAGEDPNDVASCAGGTVGLEASAMNPNATLTYYVWEQSCDNGATWEEYNAVSQTMATTVSAQLALNDVQPNMNGCQFRLRAWTNGCGEVISAPAALTVSFLPEVTQQAVPQETCGGEAVVFEVELSAPADIFWRKSCDGGITWTMIFPGDTDHEGMFTNALTVLSASANDNGCLYQAMIDDVSTGNLCGTVFSDPAPLSVLAAPEIAQQPASQTVCMGSPAIFHTSLIDLPDAVDYQWQQSCDDGASWADIDPADAAHEGVLSNTLTVASSTDNANCQYRLRAASGDCGSVFSQAALLNAKAPVAFSQMPTDNDVCPGEIVQFSAQADAFGAINYQWQMSANGVDYQDITASGVAGFAGFNTSQLTVNEASVVEGMHFRLAGSTDICEDRVSSESATISIKENISVIESPVTLNSCEGESAIFLASIDMAGQDVVQFQWQQQMSGSAVWGDLVEGPNFTGVNSGELFIGDNTGLYGVNYRLLVTGECNTILTESATITEKETISVIESPAGQDACEGESAAFFANIDMAGQDFVQLQWQQLLDGSVIWEDLAEGPNVSGVNTEELFIGNNSGLYGANYRLQATGECQIVNTESALLLTEDCSIDSNYLEMKVGLLPEGDGWGVYLRLADGFEPHEYQTALSGRVVIATSPGFGFHSLLSQAAGFWTPGTVVLENWQHPTTRYFTFDLEANDNQLLLKPGNEIMLFSFKGIGGCPKQMYIVNDESELPENLEPCEFSAIDLDDNHLFLSKIYGLDAWNCHGSNALIANDDLIIEAAASAVSDAMNPASHNVEEGLWLSPNPATEYANIAIETESENARLHLMNVQGQAMHTFDVYGQNNFRMELGNLPIGLYFVTLEVDGVVVEREKLMKR